MKGKFACPGSYKQKAIMDATTMTIALRETEINQVAVLNQFCHLVLSPSFPILTLPSTFQFAYHQI